MPRDLTAAPEPTWAAEPAPGLEPALDLLALADAGLSSRDPAARRAALAIRRWLAEDGATGPLDAALGLADGGRASARSRMRVASRDTALRRLARTHWPELGPRAAGAALAASWKRYAASAWPRDRRAPSPPIAEPAQTFFALLAAAHEPVAPETARKILARRSD